MPEKIDELYVRELVSFNLKRLRNEHKFTQDKLSERSKISANFLSEIENCKKGASFDTLAILANVFHVEPFQFFLTETVLSEINMHLNVINARLITAIMDTTDLYTSEIETKK